MTPLTCALLAVVVAAGPDVDFGDFEVTYYWLAREQPGAVAGASRNQVLRDVGGRELARVSGAFRRELDREGCGRLADGRVLNVASRATTGEWCYVVLDSAAWGLGLAGDALVPFVSIAADPARLPIGSTVVIPAFAGFPLAGGVRHSGRFAVHDVGSAIRGDRIDVFIGERDELTRVERVVASHGRTRVRLSFGAAGAAGGAPDLLAPAAAPCP